MSLTTRAAAAAVADSIGAETTNGANSKTRVGGLLRNLTDTVLLGGTAPVAGHAPFFDGSTWVNVGVLTGANLTDANQTLAIAGGAQYILPAAVPLTALRDKSLSLTGASKGLMLTIYSFGTRAFAMAVKDAGGTTLFTFPASATPIGAGFRFNNAETAWELASWSPLTSLATP
jgi:hypothetical protein